MDEIPITKFGPNVTPALGPLPNLRCRLCLNLQGQRKESEGSVIYSSHACPSTVNPTWMIPETAWLQTPPDIDMENTTWVTVQVSAVGSTGSDSSRGERAGAPSSRGISEGVWKFREQDMGHLWDLEVGGEPVCGFSFDVRHLVALSSGMTALHLPPLPPDCLFVDMGDRGLFALDSVVESLTAMGGNSGIFSKGVPSRGVTPEQLEQQQEQEALEELLQRVRVQEAAAEERRAELSAALIASDVGQKQQFEAARRDNSITRLRQELAEQEELLESEEASLMREKDILEEEMVCVNTLLGSIETAKEEVTLAESKLCTEMEGTLNSQILLEARRARLTAELKAIYPIKYQGQLGEYTIRGLELPSDLYTVDDERVSSALGYCAHLVCMLAKYLQVPLRYQLIYNASRSAVRDNITGAGVAYPLFRRGVEKERFDRGVHLLGKDVEQMLAARGVPVKRGGGQLLRNLERLITAESA
ncbi:unnamed protein product [Choristocarpus tenellus]